jgi:putative transposase
VRAQHESQGKLLGHAPMESFFSRLKVELIYAELFESIAAAKSAIFEYIEVFYN